jgi:hypothetical protein
MRQREMQVARNERQQAQNQNQRRTKLADFHWPESTHETFLLASGWRARQGVLEVGTGCLGVFARRFSSTGVGLATELQVNVYTSGSQSDPAVRLDDNGSFVVAWTGNSLDGSVNGVFARGFAADGSPLTGEIQVNTYTPNSQALPAVADAGGAFVVAWQSQLQDGSDYGVFLQRLTASEVFDIDGNGALAALSDGLLILRYLFGFRGATLITGAVDTDGCTRCTANDIETYLAGLV